MATEEKWYAAGSVETGVRQFLVQDPDGYLVRLAEELALDRRGADFVEHEHADYRRPLAVTAAARSLRAAGDCADGRRMG